jgi:hypothetical protein
MPASIDEGRSLQGAQLGNQGSNGERLAVSQEKGLAFTGVNAPGGEISDRRLAPADEG